MIISLERDPEPYFELKRYRRETVRNNDHSKAYVDIPEQSGKEHKKASRVEVHITHVNDAIHKSELSLQYIYVQTES